jgi:hypothetical protein
MQRLNRTLARAGAIAVLAALLAGCSYTDIDMEDFNVARRANNFVNTQRLSFSARSNDFTVRPVTQADLIGAQGECASQVPAETPAPLDANGEPTAAAPALVQGGIALQMTECEVVTRAGQPDNIEFGNSERGERAVVLTYIHGPRPGIYRFAGGRLFSIERGPEPPPPARKAAPARKKRQPT